MNGRSNAKKAWTFVSLHLTFWGPELPLQIKLCTKAHALRRERIGFCLICKTFESVQVPKCQVRLITLQIKYVSPIINCRCKGTAFFGNMQIKSAFYLIMTLALLSHSYDKFENQINNLTKIFTKNRLIDICIVSLRSEIYISRRGCTRQSPINRDASIGMYHLRTQIKKSRQKILYRTHSKLCFIVNKSSTIIKKDVVSWQKLRLLFVYVK